jgi:hypothetical protein
VPSSTGKGTRRERLDVGILAVQDDLDSARVAKTEPCGCHAQHALELAPSRAVGYRAWSLATKSARRSRVRCWAPKPDAVTRIRTPSSPTVDDINRIPDEGDEGNDSRSYEISISPM